MTTPVQLSTTIAAIIAREGGYVCDANDPGGATCYGITQSTADDYHAGPVQYMTIPTATSIYQRILHDYNIDLIPDYPTFDLVADCAVNHGESIGIKWLQKAIGIVPADGILGSQTQSVMTAVPDWNKVFCTILATRIRFYGRLVTASPNEVVFLDGWLARATGFLA